MSLSASPSASPTPNTCSQADFTDFPTTDAACAITSVSGLPSNTSSILSSCCKSAPVEDFNTGCGYYCLSVEQTVRELQTCFMEKGARPADIQCNANNSATATGTPSQGPSKTGEGAARETGAKGGAVQRGVSKVGLGMLGVVVVSVVMGVV